MRSPPGLIFRRRASNLLSKLLGTAATLFGLSWLVWILIVTLLNGARALSPRIFTDITPPPGPDGGLANALVGSALMSVLGVLIGAPLGIAAGTYLAEFRRAPPGVARIDPLHQRHPAVGAVDRARPLRLHDLRSPGGAFSGIAGAIALSLIVLPVVVRTTDETLRLVPNMMREAALSLGIPRWKVTVQVLYRAALPGILTGVLLGLARITGETAPLLFTALNNQFWSRDLNGPTASVPVVVFQFAMSPYDAWHSLAWAGAFVVTMLVLVLSVGARAYLLKNRMDSNA